MTRTEYQNLRHQARRAQRAWWQANKDPYSSGMERAQAWSAMQDAASLVPGGMSRGSSEVMLEGWFWRRSAVGSRITNRKARAQINKALGFMCREFGEAADVRKAA
jgi:hypothetical protein